MNHSSAGSGKDGTEMVVKVPRFDLLEYTAGNDLVR